MKLLILVFQTEESGPTVAFIQPRPSLVLPPASRLCAIYENQSILARLTASHLPNQESTLRQEEPADPLGNVGTDFRSVRSHDLGPLRR
jgi:hypothetical protein